MTNKENKFEITPPIKQLKLFGYEDYFNSFANFYKKKILPNAILLSGQKGYGKSTFIYHFVNYLLSMNEENKYSIEKFTIHQDNKSYKSLLSNSHPNFALIKNDDLNENIKIEKVRETLVFLSKSTYSSNIKIVLIDNSELLNTNSANALLKAIEDNDKNTFFFIIHNNSYKILSTIKSRCIEFKFFFSQVEKKDVLNSLTSQYKNISELNKLDDIFYFDTPGNIIKYLAIFNNYDINFLKDKLACVLALTDKYKKNNDPQLLSLITLLIEAFYCELSQKDRKNLIHYSENRSKILKIINESKKFNLDKKNLFISIQEILENEKR